MCAAGCVRGWQWNLAVKTKCGIDWRLFLSDCEARSDSESVFNCLSNSVGVCRSQVTEVII